MEYTTQNIPTEGNETVQDGIYTFANLNTKEKEVCRAIYRKLVTMYISYDWKPVHYTLKQVEKEIECDKDTYIKVMETLKAEGKIEFAGKSEYGANNYILPEYKGLELRQIPSYCRKESYREDMNNQDWQYCQEIFNHRNLKVNAWLEFDKLKEINSHLFALAQEQASGDVVDEYVRYWYENIYKQKVPTVSILTPENAPSVFADRGAFKDTMAIDGNYFRHEFLDYAKTHEFKDTGVSMFDYLGLKEFDDIINLRKEGEPHCDEFCHPNVAKMLCAAWAFTKGFGQLLFVNPSQSFEEFYNTNQAWINQTELLYGSDLVIEYLKWWYQEVYLPRFKQAVSDVGVPF